MDFIYIYVSDETQSHLQRRPQSSYDTFHLIFRHITNEHVFDVISVIIIKKDTKGYICHRKSFSIREWDSLKL